MENFDKVKESLKTIRTIQGIPVKDRLAVDVKALTTACKYVAEHQEEFYKAVTKRGFELIKVGNFQTDDTISHWMMESDLVKVPKMPNNLSQAHISELLQQMYSNVATVQGALEQLEPMLFQMEKIYDECVSIGKLISLSMTEWESQAHAALLIPSEIKETISNLKYAVDTYKRKEKALDKTYEILSRLITVEQAFVPETKPKYSPGSTGGQSYDKPDWKK